MQVSEQESVPERAREGACVVYAEFVTFNRAFHKEKFEQACAQLADPTSKLFPDAISNAEKTREASAPKGWTPSVFSGGGQQPTGIRDPHSTVVPRRTVG